MFPAPYGWFQNSKHRAENIIEALKESEHYDIIIDTQKTFLKTLSLKRIKSKIFISATASWLLSDLKLDKIDNLDKIENTKTIPKE